jgi:hypothetical protein
MSKGLGRIQRECLRAIERYEAAGKAPTTFNIVAEAYRIARDRNGNRTFNDAQHSAVKRALGSLRRTGLVTSSRKLTFLRMAQRSSQNYELLLLLGENGSPALTQPWPPMRLEFRAARVGGRAEGRCTGPTSRPSHR